VPDRQVIDYQSARAGTGADGYQITHQHSGALVRRRLRSVRARGVIVAAGTLGTTDSCFAGKLSGSLPRISDRLGYMVRTQRSDNDRMCAGGLRLRLQRRCSHHVEHPTDEDTHIEVVTYGAGGDSQGYLRQLMVTAGSGGRAHCTLALAVARHPRRALGALQVKGSHVVQSFFW